MSYTVKTESSNAETRCELSWQRILARILRKVPMENRIRQHHVRYRQLSHHQADNSERRRIVQRRKLAGFFDLRKHVCVHDNGAIQLTAVYDPMRNRLHGVPQPRLKRIEPRQPHSRSLWKIYDWLLAPDLSCALSLES